MTFIRLYLFRVISGAMLSAVLLSIPLRPSIRKLLSVSCGCVIVLLVLSPIVQLKPEDWSIRLPFASEVQENIDRNDELLQSLICEQTEALIEQTAAENGSVVHARVRLQYDDAIGSYLPYSVELTVEESAGSLDALRQFLAEELAIPEGRQTWRLK